MAKLFALNLAIMVSFRKRILSISAGVTERTMSAIHQGQSVETGGGVGSKSVVNRAQG
jgi:hypothetical protein